MDQVVSALKARRAILLIAPGEARGNVGKGNATPKRVDHFRQNSKVIFF